MGFAQLQHSVDLCALQKKPYLRFHFMRHYWANFLLDSLISAPFKGAARWRRMNFIIDIKAFPFVSMNKVYKNIIMGGASICVFLWLYKPYMFHIGNCVERSEMAYIFIFKNIFVELYINKYLNIIIWILCVY